MYAPRATAKLAVLALPCLCHGEPSAWAITFCPFGAESRFHDSTITSATGCVMPRPSSVNYWLLLAATICVDAIAMVWKYAEGAESVLNRSLSRWFSVSLAPLAYGRCLRAVNNSRGYSCRLFLQLPRLCGRH